MKIYFILVAVLIAMLGLPSCAKKPTPAPQTATIIVTFDLGGGGSGKSATIYMQDVNSGKSYSQPYSSSGHGGLVLPTSALLAFTVEAPGTYIAYANFVNAPEDYHFGATGCGPAPECTTTVLKAIDVSPGGTYQFYISDRSGEPQPPMTGYSPLAALKPNS